MAAEITHNMYTWYGKVIKFILSEYPNTKEVVSSYKIVSGKVLMIIETVKNANDDAYDSICSSFTRIHK